MHIYAYIYIYILVTPNPPHPHIHIINSNVFLFYDRVTTGFFSSTRKWESITCAICIYKIKHLYL